MVKQAYIRNMTPTSSVRRDIQALPIAANPRQNLRDLVALLARDDDYGECERPSNNRRVNRCTCQDCKPITMEEACIRYLAGYPQAFEFIG